MKPGLAIQTVLLGALSGTVAAVMILIIQGQPFRLRPVDMTYADLAATLLAASALMTAIIGLFIAALAVWGFTALRGLAKNAAKAHVGAELQQGGLRSHVESVVTDFLEKEFEDGNLRQQLEERVDAILFTAPQQRSGDDATEDDVTVGDI